MKEDAKLDSLRCHGMADMRGVKKWTIGLRDSDGSLFVAPYCRGRTSNEAYQDARVRAGLTA